MIRRSARDREVQSLMSLGELAHAGLNGGVGLFSHHHSAGAGGPLKDQIPHDFERLLPLEEQFAFPFVTRGNGPIVEKRSRDSRTAREILEDELRIALGTGTCYVAFSGGRDSSAVLAVAAHVARREGLPVPVPVTAVYPDAPATDESAWQHRVLEHLGVTERVVVHIRGEQSLLGESATSALRRRGLVWPEAAQLQGALLRNLEPGSSLVNGEGGDNVIAGGRVAPLHRLTHTWPPRRRTLRASARALSNKRTALSAPRWYTPTAAEEFRAVMDWGDPLRWDTRTRQILRRPAEQVLFANVHASIAEFDLIPSTPLVSPDFLGALAREGGPLGFGSRSQTFRHLVGDLLPQDVIRRTSKAGFNDTRWGEMEREFARSWDGSGVDPELIDAEALRAEWLSDSPHPQSDFLLHLAWTAEHVDRVGSGKNIA